MVDPNDEGRPAPRVAPCGVQRSVIEDRYPAVARSLTLLWGYPEMNQYFEKIASGQDPSIQLDPAALSEIMVLADIHRRICPYAPAKRVADLYGPGRWSEPWTSAGRRG